MKKLLFINSLFLLTINGFGQEFFAVYGMYERDHTSKHEAFYDQNIYLIVPSRIEVGDTIYHIEYPKADWYGTLFEVDTLNNGNLRYGFHYSSWVPSAASFLGVFNKKIPNIPKFKNIESDSLDLEIANVIQPYFEGPDLDTTPPNNVIFPLVVEQGQVLRFNPFNRHENARETSSFRVDGFSLTTGTTKTDWISSETFFVFSDTGYFLFRSDIWNKKVGHNTTICTYSIKVVPKNSGIPGGEFFHQDSILMEKFFYVSPDYPTGAVPLKYNAKNSDSVKFNLLPLNDPYKGFSLSYSNTAPDNYSLELSYNANSYVHYTRNSFINILVTSFKSGNPYYQTFTVHFDTAYNSSFPMKTIDPDVKIFPNPSRGNIHIEFGSGGNFQITIYSISGKQVYSGNGYGSLHEINNLTPGIYLGKINFEDRVIYKKIMIY